MGAPKPLVWLHGEIKTPPLSEAARAEAGFLLRCLQKGEKLSLPKSRPMPAVGSSCHELRIRDADQTWRVIYAIEEDAIVTQDHAPNQATQARTGRVDRR
jgi:phage-related protein